MHVEKVGYTEVDLKRRKKNSTSFGQKIKSYYVVSIQQLPWNLLNAKQVKCMSSVEIKQQLRYVAKSEIKGGKSKKQTNKNSFPEEMSKRHEH